MKKLILIGLTMMLLVGKNIDVAAATNGCGHPSSHIYAYRITNTVDCTEHRACTITVSYDYVDEICNHCGELLERTVTLDRTVRHTTRNWES